MQLRPYEGGAYLDLSVIEILQHSCGFERCTSQCSIISRDAHHSWALPHQLCQGSSGRPKQQTVLTLYRNGNRAGLVRQYGLLAKVGEAAGLLDGGHGLTAARAGELSHLDDVHLADGLAFLHDLVALVELLASKAVEGFLYPVLRQALERFGELHTRKYLKQN